GAPCNGISGPTVSPGSAPGTPGTAPPSEPAERSRLLITSDDHGSGSRPKGSPRARARGARPPPRLGGGGSDPVHDRHPPPSPSAGGSGVDADPDRLARRRHPVRRGGPRKALRSADSQGGSNRLRRRAAVPSGEGPARGLRGGGPARVGSARGRAEG